MKSAGYSYLVEKLHLNVIPHWHRSSISSTGAHQTSRHDGYIHDIYTQSYWPGDKIGNHLEFALKYDGVNLAYLLSIFNAIDEIDIVSYIHSKPTGKYARRIWFFFEFLTGRNLPLANLTTSNYTEILEPNLYYTLTPGKLIKRQRIINNLLGDRDFCPIIRRTKKLKEMDSADLHNRCKNIISSYPPELIKRALSYLYKKETKSSFEIEHIKPGTSRTERFIGLLELAEHQDFCDKKQLIDLQNRIVDPRFKETDYRTSQNYIGQTVSYQKEIIHYISPAPGELSGLMDGLLLSHQKMKEGDVSAIAHAAVVAYGFVFLHPFEDGNGRIHRFLIHNILSIRGLVPKGLMFPVSAVMLKNSAAYDSSLETYSRPLMNLIEYSLNDIGQMTVHNDLNCWYRFIDLTSQTEALYDFVKLTIENELTEELTFLINYDKTRKSIQEIIDMPDQMIDLFIRFCLQNNGSLSIKKRSAYFDFLTDDEVLQMEQSVRLGYRKD